MVDCPSTGPAAEKGKGQRGAGVHRVAGFRSAKKLSGAPEGPAATSPAPPAGGVGWGGAGTGGKSGTKPAAGGGAAPSEAAAGAGTGTGSSRLRRSISAASLRVPRVSPITAVEP